MTDERTGDDATSPARRVEGWPRIEDAIAEHAALSADSDDTWFVAQGLTTGRWYTYRQSEWYTKQPSQIPAVASAVALVVCLVAAVAGRAPMFLFPAAVSGLAVCATRAQHKTALARRRRGEAAGLPPAKKPVDLSNVSRRPPRPLPVDSPAPEPPAVESPAREPTNEELQQSWPVLPDAKDESTDSKTWNDLSWWERQQGYEKFRRQHDMGHDQLIDAIKEHQRLSATSDHQWILASDFYGRWYNYKPSEYLRWESTDLRLTIAPWAAMIAGAAMLLAGVLSINSADIVTVIIEFVLAAALLIPGLVMVTQSVRASRARARRFMPRPASPPYPLVSRPTGE